MTHIEMLTRDLRRLYRAACEEDTDAETADQDFLGWDHADEAARYLARQDRLALGLRVVEKKQPMNEPMDYVDSHGTQWIMAACGHRCGGGVTLGQKIAVCPNCQLLLRVTGHVPVVYPERIPASVPSAQPAKEVPHA